MCSNIVHKKMSTPKEECKILKLPIKAWKFSDRSLFCENYEKYEKYEKFKIEESDYATYLSKFKAVSEELKYGKWDEKKFDSPSSYKEMVLKSLGLGDTIGVSQYRLIPLILNSSVNIWKDGYRGITIPKCDEMKATDILKLYKRITGSSTTGIAQWIYNIMILYIYDNLTTLNKSPTSSETT